MRLRKEFLHRIHLSIYLGCFINQDVTFWDYPMEKPRIPWKNRRSGGKYPKEAQEKAQNPIHIQRFNSDFQDLNKKSSTEFKEIPKTQGDFPRISCYST